MNKKRKILFVCLGNICRSPLAHGIAEDIIKKEDLEIEVDSAGTGSWHVGEHPCDRSIQVAKQHGIDISAQRARQVEKSDFIKFDLIIGLDDSNIENLKNMGCINPIKLRSFDGSYEDVPDPYYFKGFDGFEEVYKIIEKGVKIMLKDFKN